MKDEDDRLAPPLPLRLPILHPVTLLSSVHVVVRHSNQRLQAHLGCGDEHCDVAQGNHIFPH